MNAHYNLELEELHVLFLQRWNQDFLSPAYFTGLQIRIRIQLILRVGSRSIFLEVESGFSYCVESGSDTDQSLPGSATLDYSKCIANISGINSYNSI